MSGGAVASYVLAERAGRLSGGVLARRARPWLHRQRHHRRRHDRRQAAVSTTRARCGLSPRTTSAGARSIRMLQTLERRHGFASNQRLDASNASPLIAGGRSSGLAAPVAARRSSSDQQPWQSAARRFPRPRVPDDNPMIGRQGRARPPPVLRHAPVGQTAPRPVRPATSRRGRSLTNGALAVGPTGERSTRAGA